MPRPINFLFITTFYPPYHFGGDAIGTYRLAHALGELGHSVDVIHCVDSYHLLHPGEPEIVFAEHPNVHRHGLKSGYGWLSPLLSQQTGHPFLKSKSIQAVLDSKPFDIIHFHNISLFGPDILTISQPDQVAIKVYTTHEHWLICPTHVLWKFNSRPCEKPECFRCTIQAKKPPQIWRYTGMIKDRCKFVDAFFSPSEFTAKMHRDRGFYCEIHTLPDFAERRDTDWQIPGQPQNDSPYFLFVGRLEYIKGLHTLIEIWKDEIPYDLLVAGSGSQESKLRKMAEDNPRIKFVGNLSPTDLGNYYTHAIATIVPSITYETFGIVIAESFARKTPVIVRDLGALPELIIESGGGIIYRTDDELIEAIQVIGGSRSYRDELGEKGYALFLIKYTLEACLDTYFLWLNDIAKRKIGVIPWN